MRGHRVLWYGGFRASEALVLDRRGLGRDESNPTGRVRTVTPVLVAAAGPEPKDVVIAAIGASGVFAGLVLVFLGVIAAAARAAQREHMELEGDFEELKRHVDELDRESGGQPLGLGVGGVPPVL